MSDFKMRILIKNTPRLIVVYYWVAKLYCLVCWPPIAFQLPQLQTAIDNKKWEWTPVLFGAFRRRGRELMRII